MTAVFVSHSSKDDLFANQIGDWLTVNGFSDVFVDHNSISGGDKWQEKLRESAHSCRAVICLITKSWLSSADCFSEFVFACLMGKPIIPLMLLPDKSGLTEDFRGRLNRVSSVYQGIDLTNCLTGAGELDLKKDPAAAESLRRGLRATGANSEVGLDPRVFNVDRSRRSTPFPGLESFGDDDADAALFFGRSREIARTLEDLRKIRAEGDKRIFVILGSSGSGKSSLLKAGILPRLRREAPGWLVLRSFRPGADPLLNFADAIVRTQSDLGTVRAAGAARDRLLRAWRDAERMSGDLTESGLNRLTDLVEQMGQELRALAGGEHATILVSVDQAEEMARSDNQSCDVLADFIRAVLRASNWQLALTVRTDSFSELLSHPRFKALETRSYDLRAIPNFRFDTVIEEPARLYGVSVADELVDGLIEDAPKEDALPLLAFALQRLWFQYAPSGALTLENYRSCGGLKQLIEEAAERALRGMEPGQDVPLPATRLSPALAALGSSTFVPALAQVNDQGMTIRRIAHWSEFTEEQQEILKRFDRWRLLIRKGDKETATVEIAHEALFREWSRLKSWLEPERERLDALRSLDVDSEAWDRNRRDEAFLNHRDKRLKLAKSLSELTGYKDRVGELARRYIAACSVAELALKRRQRRVGALIAVLIAGGLAAGLAWMRQDDIRDVYREYAVTRPYMDAHVRPLPIEKERELAAGTPFKDCARESICPEMLVIRAGRFEMGSDKDKKEDGHDPNEEPRITVNIPKRFAVGKYEVTSEEWDVCVRVGDCRSVDHRTYGGGRQPVITVSWHDAQKYVEWWSRMTGKQYRLLTEAEFEYAARGGADTVYPWGDKIGKNLANCKGCESEHDNRWPAPVGSFPANGFGLHDMIGNVWEWVGDCWNENYEFAPRDGSLRTTGDCTRRVARGGSWNYEPGYLRSAQRSRNASGMTDSNLGFRVARSLAQ